MSLGPHAVFIAAAYLATLVILGALIAWVILDRRQLVRQLGDIEARGTRNRAAPATPAAQHIR